MKRKINISRVLSIMVLFVVLGIAAGNALDVFHTPGGTLGMAALVFLKSALFGGGIGGGGHYAVGGIQVEIWQDHIEGNLFKDNEFLLATTDAGQYVLQGKVVHIPQAGATASVTKNRSSLPASVGTRTDTDITYQIDEYTSDPILIPNADQIELSYNKRDSVLSEHQQTLRERMADELLITWAPVTSTRIMRTSGDAVDTHISGTTGSRLKFTTKDLKAAQNMMNKQNVPAGDRYCLMSADMYNEFTDSMTESQYRDFSAAMDPKTGVVGQLFGFKIFQRSSAVVYNTDATSVNAYGAAAAATDNDAVICWHKSAIERATGEIKFYERVGDPLYYGDVYSFLVRMGGRKRRTDEKGLVAIVQASAGA